MEIYDIYKIMNNPQAYIQSNPQLQQILKIYNGDAKAAFYDLCKQKGVNPDDILKKLK